MTTMLAASISPDHVMNCLTMAELKTLEPEYPGQLITVNSYYANGKGGGGDFYYDHTDVTSCDDGGRTWASAMRK